MDTKQQNRNNQTSGFGRIKSFFNDLFEQLDEIEWAMDKIKYPQSPLEEARKKAMLEARAKGNATSEKDLKDKACRVNYAN